MEDESLTQYIHVEAHTCENCGEYEEITFTVTSDGSYIDVEKLIESPPIDF